MKKNLPFLLLSSYLLRGKTTGLAGAYRQLVQPKIPKIEAEVKKNYKPKVRKNSPPETVEKQLKAFKKCRANSNNRRRNNFTEVTIPITRVTSWVKSSYSSRR